MCGTHRLEGLHLLRGGACLLRRNHSFVGLLCPAMTGDFRSLWLQPEVPSSQTSACKTCRSPVPVPTGWRPRAGGQAASAITEAASAPQTLTFGVVRSTCSPEEGKDAHKAPGSGRPEALSAGLAAEGPCRLSCCSFVPLLPLRSSRSCALNRHRACLPPAAGHNVFPSTNTSSLSYPLDSRHSTFSSNLFFQYLQIYPMKRLNIPHLIKCIYAELLDRSRTLSLFIDNPQNVGTIQ